MAFVCQNCGKAVVFGRSQSHRRGVAGKRWKKRSQETKRLFRPNLQAATINGKKMLLCTDCLGKFRKTGKLP